MAMTSTERVRRFRQKVRDPAKQRATILAELYEICLGRRPANPTKLKAIALWLEIYEGIPTIALGKKAAAELKSKEPPPEDSPWFNLLN